MKEETAMVNERRKKLKRDNRASSGGGEKG